LLAIGAELFLSDYCFMTSLDMMAALFETDNSEVVKK
jgi:hypothetical protein